MMKYLSQGLGIDLGTANTLIYERGNGIVLNEPSVVAVRPGDRKILAVGSEAKQMLGKTPGQIMAVRPMREGVIADFDMTKIMLKYFIQKVMARRLFKNPNVVVCVPCGITDVEKRAVEEAARSAGARDTFLMDEPVASAIGAGLDISLPRGRMILDIGGGTSEVAVISLNGIVVHRSLRVGGNYMDEAISDYVRKKYNVYIGESTAELVKIEIGDVREETGEETLEIKGRSLISGLPASVTISSKGVKEALTDSVTKILLAVRQTLENTPPELTADIYEDGIVMAGGTSMLRGLDEQIYRETGVRAFLAEEPLDSVVRGAGAAIEQLMHRGGPHYAMRAEA